MKKNMKKPCILHKLTSFLTYFYICNTFGIIFFVCFQNGIKLKKNMTKHDSNVNLIHVYCICKWIKI
jgi:hypothetical protein